MQVILTLLLLICAFWFLGGVLRVLFAVIGGLFSVAVGSAVLVVGLGFGALAFNQRAERSADYASGWQTRPAASAATSRDVPSAPAATTAQGTRSVSDAELQAAIDGLTFTPASEERSSATTTEPLRGCGVSSSEENSEPATQSSACGRGS